MTPEEAHAALARSAEPEIRAAMKVCSGEEVYLALRFHMQPLPFLWEALAEPAKADPRWLAGLDEVHAPHLTLVMAMARDADDRTATEAFARLFGMLHVASGLALRGMACAYLGQLRNPRATPELVEEMMRPSTGVGMSGYCIEALERCGDETALPPLRTKIDSPWREEARQAMDAIRLRRGRLDFEQVRQARAHVDPTIANLAKRVQLGDEDAYLVLEDALRERAR